MRVLMFGWELPPYNSGGLGVACYHLAKALCKKNTEVIFVLPSKVTLPPQDFTILFADANMRVRTIDSPLTPYVTSSLYLSFMSANAPSEQLKTMTVILTGYSSTPDQTDDTPFITASGSQVRDGIVATNFLNFGTKVKIPAIFGDKIFTVEDRMAKKHSDKIDIWFPERQLAKKFGIQKTEILVLQ